ncbi:MAG TPA: hypothetical protein VFM75_02055 [Modicisalibacter sp.]|nr:hypothetical protein [Modicisalibacter sp.]
MSGVKRYYAPGLDFMWRDQKDAPRECIPMVLASDYDKLACMVEVGHKLAMDAACGEIAALEAERDALRAQVGAMRGALERAREVVAFHHVTAGDRFREIELAAIDAALQVEP